MRGIGEGVLGGGMTGRMKESTRRLVWVSVNVVPVPIPGRLSLWAADGGGRGGGGEGTLVTGSRSRGVGARERVRTRLMSWLAFVITCWVCHVTLGRPALRTP